MECAPIPCCARRHLLPLPSATRHTHTSKMWNASETRWQYFSQTDIHTVVKVDRRIRWWHYTTTILRLRALVHDSRSIEIVNFTISLALSAGTLMASAGTPYRLVPAHFYPWTPLIFFHCCMAVSSAACRVNSADDVEDIYLFYLFIY